MNFNSKTIGQFTLLIEGQAEEIGHALDPLNLALIESQPVTPDMISAPRAAIRRLRDSLDALEQQLRSDDVSGQ